MGHVYRICPVKEGETITYEWNQRDGTRRKLHTELLNVFGPVHTWNTTDLKDDMKQEQQ